MGVCDPYLMDIVLDDLDGSKVLILNGAQQTFHGDLLSYFRDGICLDGKPNFMQHRI